MGNGGTAAALSARGLAARLLAAVPALVASAGIAAAEVRMDGDTTLGPRLDRPCEQQDPRRLGVYDRQIERVIAQLHVEIADDEAERSQGLMNRDHLARAAGMLFVYPSERPVAFWMRNTLIPLDIIFIDARGKVVGLHANAKPLDETPIPSGVPVRFVLEVNGGLAQRLGITPGAVVSHPAIPSTLGLPPCD